jgi:hypothetical protein
VRRRLFDDVRDHFHLAERIEDVTCPRSGLYVKGCWRLFVASSTSQARTPTVVGLAISPDNLQSAFSE